MDTRTAPQAAEHSMYMIMSNAKDEHHIVHIEREDVTLHELDGYTTTLCNEHTDEWWAIAIVPREKVLMCSVCLRAMIVRQQLALERAKDSS